jgi:hypothetical protein
MKKEISRRPEIKSDAMEEMEKILMLESENNR